MANYMYHKVAKGVQDNPSGDIMTWWKTNFNMPVPQLFDGTWIEGVGPFIYHGLATSFDLTGLVTGWEVAVFMCGWHWEGPLSGTAYIYSEWRDENNVLMFTCVNGDASEIDVASGYYQEHMYGCNQGIAGWEIDVAGNYRVRSWSTGVGAMGQQDTIIAFSNVPSTSQLGADKPGYIWIEGNNLCYIDANQWKHSIVGDKFYYVDTAKAGYMWIDTNNYLCWIGADGYDYKTKWKIKQFASTWSNGPTNEVYAGTDKAGMIWVDDEFGQTHLSYIGYDGYKYLVGDGEYPYDYPV